MAIFYMPMVQICLVICLALPHLGLKCAKAPHIGHTTNNQNYVKAWLWYNLSSWMWWNTLFMTTRTSLLEAKDYGTACLGLAFPVEPGRPVTYPGLRTAPTPSPTLFHGVLKELLQRHQPQQAATTPPMLLYNPHALRSKMDDLCSQVGAPWVRPDGIHRNLV